MAEIEHPSKPQTPDAEKPQEPTAASSEQATSEPAPAPQPPAPETPGEKPAPAPASEPVAQEQVESPEAPTESRQEAPAPRPTPRGSRIPPDGNWWWGTGRRKAAIARVRLRPGTGRFVVNKRPHEEFFTSERDREDLLNVLRKTNTNGTLDVFVNVRGGGFTGQAGAIVLGLARALRRYDESLEPILRDNNFLTRDPRKVERKKYGQPGARRRFQFSKR
jgi:small subunit ribosomal protein S9